MPQSLANVLLHTVFLTKNREPWLADDDLRNNMHAYLGGVAHQLNCVPLCIGGVADHVHLLTSFSRTLTIAEFVKELKRVSTLWLHDQDHAYDRFHWQRGYGVFSVSESQIPTVRSYIANQEEHHRTRTFQDEYRLLLKKHGVEFDERYVWD